MERAKIKHLRLVSCTVYSKLRCETKLQIDEERVKCKEI